MSRPTIPYESEICHEGETVLQYRFTTIGNNDKLLTDIIKQLNSKYTQPPSNKYAYALKFREKLFFLKEHLYTYIANVFRQLQEELLNDPDINTLESVLKFCTDRFRVPTIITTDYDFNNWGSDVWTLAKFFSPTLAQNSIRRLRNPKSSFNIDIQSLLEILEQYCVFDIDIRNTARAVKNDRNTLYAHLSERGIRLLD